MISLPHLNQQHASRSGTYKWVVVGLLWFICFFNYADRTAIYSVFPLLEKQYHLTKSELGLIGAAFTWVYAVGSPLGGYVGDRFPRKRVILVGLYIWSLITVLTAQCTRFWQFMLVRGSEGLGETFYIPASMALISDYHAPDTRSRAIGFHQTSIYAGTIGGSALAGWMALRFGWQKPFIVLGMAGIVLGLILKVFIREPERNQAERLQRSQSLRADGVDPEGDAPAPVAGSMRAFLIEFLRTPTAVLLVAAFFGANMVGLVFLTWMPTFLKEKYHLNLGWASLGATVFIQLASMVGASLGGVVADRWCRTRIEGRILVQAFGVLLGAPFIFLCGYTRIPWVLVVAMTLFGLCKGIYDSNLTPAFYDVIRPERRSTATGMMNLIGWIGAGLGSFGIGAAVDHHITMSVAISSTALIYLAVGMILLYTAFRTVRGDIRAVRLLPD
jgi:MFS family permease